MNCHAKIAAAASPSTAIQFRESAYGTAGIREFLRDVIAMANANLEGPRHIVVGMHAAKNGKRQVSEIPAADFEGKPSYQGVVNEFIEPQVRIRYEPVTIDGQRVGIYEIGDCQDRPYMMRVDLCETLRRGDAYARVNDAAIKLGRRQLQAMFEQKFRDSISAADVEIGFPGEIIHKQAYLPSVSLEGLPSLVAARKIEQMIDIRRGMRSAGSTTMVARLTHARLFGTDRPYEHRSTETLSEEMLQVAADYRDQDERYLFDEHATRLQLIVSNQGGEAISDASLTIMMPNHPAFHVAKRLPKVLRNSGFVDRPPEDQARYPVVSMSEDAVKVTAKIGDIACQEHVEVFDAPLRVCVGEELAGRKIGVQYTLRAQNLRASARGKLRLIAKPA